MSEKTDQILRELGYYQEKEIDMSDIKHTPDFEEFILEINKSPDAHTVRDISDRIIHENDSRIDEKAVEIAREENAE